MKRVLSSLLAAVIVLGLLLGGTAGCKKANLPDVEGTKPAKGSKGGSKLPTAEEKAAKREAARAKGMEVEEKGPAKMLTEGAGPQ